jgi:hypothetical protein
MAPTAMSPPYSSREELKQTEITLSLACIIKVAVPRATQGKMIFGVEMKYFGFNLRMLRLLLKKDRTHAQESACDMIVASAAPRTPMPHP